ncbi:MAG: hypothetical protein AAB177_14805, partial [Nitrospirota bacterium]
QRGESATARCASTGDQQATLPRTLTPFSVSGDPERSIDQGGGVNFPVFNGEDAVVNVDWQRNLRG